MPISTSERGYEVPGSSFSNGVVRDLGEMDAGFKAMVVSLTEKAVEFGLR